MPWVDDPETGTSHYERAKKKKPSVEERKTAEAQESFGDRMARIKREKAQAQEDAAAVVAKIMAGEVDPG
jgi:hypothetical protein